MYAGRMDLGRAITFVIGLPLAFALGCASHYEDGDPDGEPVSEIGEALHRDRACFGVPVVCDAGYHVKQLPSCNKICVKDKGYECNKAADCGIVYCIDPPCRELVCRSHECVVADQPPYGQRQ